MSNSIYEEALDTIVDNLQYQQDKEYNCCVLDPKEMNKIAKTIRQAQKQEKLLELYKGLATVRDDMLYLREVLGDDYGDLEYIETGLEKQIDEIEKQISEIENEN